MVCPRQAKLEKRGTAKKLINRCKEKTRRSRQETFYNLMSHPDALRCNKRGRPMREAFSRLTKNAGRREIRNRYSEFLLLSNALNPFGTTFARLAI